MILSLHTVKDFLKPHSISKNISLALLIFFLFVATYLAASWGATDASAIKPRQLMLKWADNKIPFSDEKWQIAIKKMQLAIKNTPSNAEHHFDLARLYDWNAYQKPIWNEESIKYRTQAIKYYKKSLELRPTWSSAWVNLAMSQTLNLEFGNEVKAALLNAMKYGPWEKDVFHKTLWISLANWTALPLNLQEQVKMRIKETVNSKGQVPSYIEETAKHFNWLDELNDVIGKKGHKP